MPNEAAMCIQDTRSLPTWWHRSQQWFLLSAALILIVTAVIKLLSALQEVQVLGRLDPVFWFLTKRQLLVVTAMLEGIVAGIILKSNRREATYVTLILVFSLSSIFLCYRLGLWWSGYSGECSCFGNATQWLGTSPDIMNRAAQFLLGYLLAGSTGMLAWRHVRASRPSEPRTLGNT